MKTRMTPMLAGVLALSVGSPAGALTLFGLVDTGELYASIDGGVSWTVRSTLPARDAVALVAGATSAEFFLATENGSLYRSDDAGMNWSAISTIPASDVAAAVGFSGHLILLTRSGSVYSSTDHGASFSAVGTITAPDVASGARHLGSTFALTRTGSMYRSGDDGATWTAIGTLVVANAVGTASFGGKLYVLTASGDLARSDDSGANWNFVSTLSQVAVTALLASTAELVACTEGGEMAATANGTVWTWRGVIGQLTVRALASDIPAVTGVRESLARRGSAFLPPWPNPAGTAVQLAFELDREAAAAVGAYDLAGRLVARPLQERLPAGRSVRVWQPMNLPAGVYTLRATIGGTHQARRVVWLGTSRL